MELDLYDIAAKLEETHKQQTDLLFGLIHVGPKLLQQFIDSTRQDLSLLHSLCQKALKTHDYLALVEPAFRLIHTIKGNAALLDLTVYKSYAMSIEDEFARVEQDHAAASAAWVADILNKAKKIEVVLNQTEKLLAELMTIQSRDERELSASQMFLSNARILVEQLRRQFNKQVKLCGEHFDLSLVDERLHENVVEILTQMISNAIAHGIEKPEQRRACGKHPVGLLYLRSDIVGDQIRIRVQDDGAGPNIERIKKLVSCHTQYHSEQIEAMSNMQLVALIFTPGLSTAEATTDIAGRGVGMDMIRQLIEQIGGRLEFRYALGQGCQFDIVLPCIFK